MAEEIASLIRREGFSPFYDRFYPERTWGQDLAVYLDEVYRKDSRYCLILASKEYFKRVWPAKELQSALARAVSEKGERYALIVKVDDVELPGIPPTIGYLSAQEYCIKDIAQLLAKLLSGG